MKLLTIYSGSAGDGIRREAVTEMRKRFGELEGLLFLNFDEHPGEPPTTWNASPKFPNFDCALAAIDNCEDGLLLKTKRLEIFVESDCAEMLNHLDSAHTEFFDIFK